MSTTPTVLLVHGAFAESASWNGVITRLQGESVRAVAVANPLRSVAGDGDHVRAVADAIGGPVLLVGHSYGGMVISHAGADNPNVAGLVYVAAFVPETGESALELSAKFPGSTLGDALLGYPVPGGDVELRITGEKFHQQFAHDVPADLAATMAATQRPVTEAALKEALAVPAPWRAVPTWSIWAEQDRNIPAELEAFTAERAATRAAIEIAGASHALSVSQPDAVAKVILEAVRTTS
ncbi:alpha/beta hydrolase [Occultella glacieicola]|uniref:Alpha/beta hydrolase n=1 Tax=Occultella glacieicola TaxID=2518684 RepID=A0ABY2E2Q7_9MICO|nr:alpha/beta hydrolase [Occultella glacieicola]TDE92688.1 alpha/beta hydrolase [Occultella glacieicola]